MNQGLALLGGVGLGAGLVYFLDPQQGRRRRTQLRDRAVRLSHEAGDACRTVSQDLGNRARGLAAEARHYLTGDEADDRVIEERVRSQMGRYVSHPSALDVTCRNGRILLSGPILAHEVEDLLGCVGSVRGVRAVENRLEVHRDRGNVPALQGGTGRPGQRMEVMQENWAPATRCLAATAGSALIGLGLTQRFPTACLLGTAGLALLARAGTNRSFGRMLGVCGGRRAVDVHKTITVDGPVERVFPFWANYENFPRFMSHVREVRDLGNGRSRWTVLGPAGVPVSWNAVLTRFEENQVIAWKSEPGSAIANAGIIRFEPQAGDRTRVDVRLSYNPPGGALGHLAALLFGADPKSALDEDLVRFKSLIEDGKTSAPGKGEVARQDVAVEAGTTAGLGQPAL